MSRNVIVLKTKNQKLVDLFIKWDSRYSDLVNENDRREDQGKSRKETPQENAYNKAAEAWDNLPKYEQQNLSKQMDCSGY